MIRVLGQIQSLDARIKSLTGEKDTVPRELVESRRRLGEIEQDVQGLAARLKDAQMRYKAQNGELSNTLDAIKKFKQQQCEVKTNDAYFALTKEIEEAEFKKLEIEEDVLRLMESSELLSDSLKENNGQLLRGREGLCGIEEENKKRVQALTEQISRLRQERISVAEKVDKPLLARYDKIRELRDGFAFVPVRGGSCGGCFMKLPPEVINEAMLEKKIVTCENCARILYWEGESR